MTLAVGVASATAAGGLRAPDPGGSETAIVRVPPPGPSYLGVHEPGIVGGSAHDWTPAQTARVARGAGAEILRFTIDWTFVEPAEDVWDEQQWARYETAYRALISSGLKPLIGVSTAPPWARDFGVPSVCGNTILCPYPPRTEKLGEWAEFAAEVARRFPRAAAIEIWNEPNHSAFWKPAPEPERYASLVTSAYDAIKAESPQIAVLAGALAGADTTQVDPSGTSVVSVNEFLSRAYLAPDGIAGHMDGISFHQASQRTRFRHNSELALAFHGARTARRAHDSRRTPLWITEFGLSTSDGPIVTPSVQADALLRAYRKVITMPDVRGFVIHTLADRAELDRSDQEYGVGLVSSADPFVPKPSYCAFTGRTRKPLGGCRRVRESRVSSCSRSLARLKERILDAGGDGAATLKRRYRRTIARCVPCVRKSGAAAPRCAPCLHKLTRLQRRYARAIPTLKLDILNRHERVRRHC